MTFKVPEQHRLQAKGYETEKGDLFGCFRFPSPDPLRVNKCFLFAIASCGDPELGEDFAWEHVSVRAIKNINGSARNLVPTWTEMTLVKSLFWDDEDAVIQIHPPKDAYVNLHDSVLHLWRPSLIALPMPAVQMV